jgi:hypothetical protein
MEFEIQNPVKSSKEEYRLRLEAMTIKLGGPGGHDIPDTVLFLSSNGRYEDCPPKGKPLLFIGKPGRFICDGPEKIAKFQSMGYMPSLYSVWTIEIQNADDRMLESIQSIKINCRGKAYPKDWIDGNEVNPYAITSEAQPEWQVRKPSDRDGFKEQLERVEQETENDSARK